MSKHTPRYFFQPVVLPEEVAPARWGIFDRLLSSDEAVASATSASLAEKIVGALNAGS